MNTEFFIKQLGDVLNDFNTVKSKAKYDDLSGNTTIEEISSVISKAKAAIVRIVGTNSEYYKDIESTLVRRCRSRRKITKHCWNNYCFKK